MSNELSIDVAMAIKDIQYVQCNDISALQRSVKYAIGKGFEPFNAIKMTEFKGQIWYVQALVKYEYREEALK